MSFDDNVMPEELKGRIREIINTPHGSVLEDALTTLIESECALRVGMAVRAAGEHRYDFGTSGCVCGWKPTLKKDSTSQLFWKDHILSLDTASVAALDARLAEAQAQAFELCAEKIAIPEVRAVFREWAAKARELSRPAAENEAGK